MKLHEKIKKIIKEKGMKLTTLHKRIVIEHGENSISYLTLHRTIHGKTQLRESNLFQIASGLGVGTGELRKDTEYEILIPVIRCKDNYYIEVLEKKLPFSVNRLTLLPGGKTEVARDPAGREKYTKWIYGLRGEIKCFVIKKADVELKIVKRNDWFAFDSTLNHKFENNVKSNSCCLIYQNPKYL